MRTVLDCYPQVKGHLPSVVESARLMVVQLRAVHDMAQASNDVEKLQVQGCSLARVFLSRVNKHANALYDG